MGTKVSTIAFDADDTLWQNEAFFRVTQERFAALLADFTDPDHLTERLLDAERRNIGHYGFGVKGFTLSMIETAIDVTEEQVPASVIRELIAAGQEMLSHPIHLLPHAAETVARLAEQHEILLITKGDLLDQERKLAQSGLGDLFDGVHVVSDKSTQTYLTAFADPGPETAVMVGNSLKSDIIPALDAGAWGVHVPHDLTWAYEQAEAPLAHSRFREISHLGVLPGLISEFEQI
ncbi:HAD family hydrolase [Aliiroseovarius sp.]|uniref:HAD family hydrolase n=1 Tax=Aliiroseovarius sp. TaxID=1872442 RepID=UPI00260169C5|nr:HAD family hydrolase [Aliiroseovarius sp.]